MKVGECQFEGLEILTAKEAIVAAVRATRASRAAAGK
jgi:large subunit ribosomal protein L25